MVRWGALVVLVAALLLAGCNPAAVQVKGTATVVSTRTPTARATSSTSKPGTVVASPTATKAGTVMPTPNAERPIAVSEPKPQQVVKTPLKIAGLARVYEGTVRAEVVDAKGTVLAQSFTTASAGGPEVGSFSLTLQFTAPAKEETGTVRVYGDDPRSGTRVGLVEVPVTLSR